MMTVRTASIMSAGFCAFAMPLQSASFPYLTQKLPTARLTFSQKLRSISASVPTCTVEKSNVRTRNELRSGVGLRPMSVMPNSSSKRSLRSMS